jgi:hypothetical protein
MTEWQHGSQIREKAGRHNPESGQSQAPNQCLKWQAALLVANLLFCSDIVFGDATR